MKRYFIFGLGLFFVLFGIGVGFYPEASSYINSKSQSFVIEKHETYIANIPEDEFVDDFSDAQLYNDRLFEVGNIRQAKVDFLRGEYEEYESLLNVNGDGIIGVLKIPSIEVELPIYHGTEKPELAVGVGHMEYTSLPIGTPNSHVGICGHTALATAKLLDGLHYIEVGDEFYIKVLNSEFKYKIDDIRIINPEDYDCLNIVEGKEYVTLITCTPPGIGSQRLLVRGERVIE